MPFKAAAEVMGDTMSFFGQQAANNKNIELSHEQMQWQEMMSDTAMQRRVKDLKAAGLNPMLAVGGPGATTGSVSMPQVQNAAAGFQNMGQNVGTWLQTKAQVDNIKADTAMKVANTPGSSDIPLKADGTPDWTAYATGADAHKLGNMTAAQMAVSIQQGQSLTEKIQQDTSTGKSQMSLNQIQATIQNLNQGVLQQTYQWLVKSAIADAKIDMANVAPAEAEAKLMSGPKGPWIRAIQGVLPAAVGSAKGIMEGANIGFKP